MASDSPTVDSKTLVLRSSDGVAFVVDEVVAMESVTIRNMIEDECTENGIPLPNVTGRILAMVIEFCKRHTEGSSQGGSGFGGVGEEDLKAWDANFVKVDRATLFDLILVRDAQSLGFPRMSSVPLIWR